MSESIADHIWKRQYAIHPDETYDQGLRRVAKAVAAMEPSDELAEENYYVMMASNKFLPGGRIFAGADTEHGNLLNCFVQDGSPEQPGSTAWAMNLAKKLALVTKVGGGNGLNLDSIPAKTYFEPPGSSVAIVIADDHPDRDNVLRGRYFDQSLGIYLDTDYCETTQVAGITDTYTKSDFALVEEDYVVITVGDSVAEIWDAAAEMVAVILQRKRVALDLSNLRPEGSAVHGSGGTSSGPASFAVGVFGNFARWARLGGAEHAGPVATLRYVFAPTLKAIRQAGVRRGAGMATLSVSHPDIRDFITSKDLDREQAEGDIGTFNISVLMTDDFMAQATATYPTPEKDVLQQIAEHAHATGEPGMLYVDTINRHNPLAKVDGPIMATNPCGEIVLYPGEPCDLGAINLAAHLDDFGGIDLEELENTTRVAVSFLDNVLDAEKAPLPEIQEAIQDKRRIGLGVMGLADMLIQMGLRYDSAEGREAVALAIDTIRDAALSTSIERGKKFGVPAGVQRAVEAGTISLPRRNIALLTVAPTGTTSMLAEVSSGVEPVYAAAYTRRIGTEYKQIVHPLLKELLSKYENQHWDWDKIAEDITANGGSVIKAMRAHPELRSLLESDIRLQAFVTAHEIAPEDHVRMQAEVQSMFDFYSPLLNQYKTYCGNSISKTINLPHEASVRDVLDVYQLGYRLGLKGITVYRDGSRDYQVLTVGETTSQESSDEEGLRVTEDPAGQTTDRVFDNTCVVERPASVLGTSHKHEVAGKKMYVQVFSNDDAQVVEVWTPAPKGATASERTAHEIVGRLASLALKHGAPAEKVAEAFAGHLDTTGGIAKGVGYVGSKWELVANAIRQAAVRIPFIPLQPHEEMEDALHTLRTQSPDACPDCGASLVKEEGCMNCYSCGYSACG